MSKTVEMVARRICLAAEMDPDHKYDGERPGWMEFREEAIILLTELRDAPLTFEDAGIAPKAAKLAFQRAIDEALR